MNPSIIIADDHPLILKGLNDFLIEKKFNVLESAENGKDAFNLIETLQPDIAILDIQMPHLTGLEIAQKCQENQFKTKIILITFEKDEAIYLEAKNLNVYGYVLKEFALNEIEHCITSVKNDTPYFSPELLEHLEHNNAVEKIALLTKTEKKVLQLIATNKTAKEIGEALFISNRTVEKHKSNVIAKLQLESKANSLYLFAKENENYLG
ncbi:MAG: DNA-binding response regulator [Bacteroidetes bacterium MedPE-SWsnd-G2]|nr:MAG: DNA-binding response regulator [Bacteroidetes bacterium MedPE-SWsnd-G2]